MAQRFEALNRLFESVRESSHDFRVTTDPFPPLDPDKLAKTLDLTKKGSANGAENKPASTAKEMDEVEESIIEAVENVRSDSYQILEDQFGAYAARLRNLDFTSHFAKIHQASIASLSEFKLAVSKGRDELFGLRRHLKEADAELADFKERNGLKRTARTASGTSKIIKWLIVFVLLFVETAVNGIYLAEGNSQGLVGGIGVAFGFAFVNVFATVALGLKVIPYIRHRMFLKKVWGFLGVCGWLVVALCVNFVMAHYREVSAESLAQVGILVMERIKNAPFHMADINSWVLFATGFLFSVGALLDSLSMQDPYPKYSETQSRYDAAREYYIDQKVVLTDQLQSTRDNLIQTVEDVLRRLTDRRREYGSIIDNRTRTANLYMEHQSSLEIAARKLLQVYREANRQTRTKPEPKYWSTQFKLERRKAVPNTGEDWSDQELAEGIKKAQTELSDHMRQIGQEFEKALEQYDQLDTLFPEYSNGTTQTKI